MTPAGSNLSNELTFSSEALALAFQDLGGRLNAARAANFAERREFAADFNVFDFIAPSENVLSDILAFLLDPRSSHGQGALFLEKLMSRLCSARIPNSSNPVVARESLTYAISNHRRRIDIQVTFPDFVFAIETKKFTGEGWNQIADYCEHLEMVSGNRFCLVFLTRTGEEAGSIDPKKARTLIGNGKLALCSWEADIPAWLRECAAVCEAPKIKHFLEDFVDYIQNLAINCPEETDNEQE